MDLKDKKIEELERNFNETNKMLLQIFKILGEMSERIIYLYDVRTHVAHLPETTAKLFDLPTLVDHMPERANNLDFVLPESKETFIKMHHQIEEGQSISQGIIKLHTTNGVDTVYELTLIRVTNEDGTKTNGCIGVFKDVTQRYIKDISTEQYNKIVDEKLKVKEQELMTV